MLYIVIGNAAVYLLYMLTGYDAAKLSFLSFNLAGLMRGEIWRIVTYIFVPGYGSIFWMLIALYFYYWIGSTLERQWGTAKFNLYYIGGVLLTVVGTIIASLISGQYGLTVAGTGYINLSMFLAFALLFPDTQVLLFFIIPIKMKWLAILDGGLFAWDIISSLLHGNLAGVVLPIFALLNFAVFIYPELHYFTEKRKYQHSRQTVQFKRAVKEQQQQKGYHHKCAVCGRTDTDYPDLQFRYCSKCAGYHCFCQDHIFSHVHFTE
ncbi:MAG: rhomboid family intramembrane serine protease [Clostridiales bacterium]|nr:rhomboid family intramembrane serine protease [Clostridiales bacterium]